MKFKEYTHVVVTNVSPRAAPYVVEGMTGIVQPIENPEHAAYAEDLGLNKVYINGYTFWWREKDLEEYPEQPVKLTVVDEGHYIPPNKREFGYDPYNSVNAFGVYMRVRHARE
jgi:hypothetical protein